MSSASDNVENAGDIPVINKVEQGNNPDDNLDMEDGEADVFSIARDHQPSTIRFFPDTINHNGSADFQGRNFNINGVACACNLDFGLILHFDHIMGFFCKMVERGCNMRVNKLSPLAMLNVSKTASMIPNLQCVSKVPHLDDQDRELSPNTVLSTLAVKSNVDASRHPSSQPSTSHSTT